MNTDRAVDMHALNDASNPTYRSLVASQFSTLTAENVMKWESLEPTRQPSQYGFDSSQGADVTLAGGSRCNSQHLGCLGPGHLLEMPQDKGIAVYGEGGKGDPAGLEGGVAKGGVAGGEVGGAIALPEDAVPPIPDEGNDKPVYPQEARATGQQGMVVLKVT